MKSKMPLTLTVILLLAFLLPVTAYAIPGDADGNGVVDLEDARTIARYAAGQIASVPNPANADANQDGKIDMEDAFIISKRVTGQTRIVVVAPLNGSPDLLRTGGIVRIEVFEKFFPFNITGGKVRIQSATTGYDSGDQTLTFERNGRSLYYHWNTAGLAPATDYAISVNLTSRTGSSVMSAQSATAGQPDATASLTNEVFKPRFLANVVDAYCPAPGIPLEFRRHVPNNAPAYPYLGPLGRGWFHSYDFRLEDYTDGRIALRNRIFQSNNNGTYQSSPGDYGLLVRNPDGTFQLKEKDGTIYRFRSDLYLNYIQDLNGNRISAIYDASNHLIEVRHSCGKSFFLTYNAAGRISTLTDHVGRVTTYEYDPSNLMLIKATDPAGNVTDYTYAMGGALYILELKLVCLDAQGNQQPCPAPILDYRLQSIGYPDGTRMQYDYDGQARLVRQTGAWGANPVTYGYDADGTTHVADALGASATVRVNDKGQPTVVTTADGAQTSNQYDASTNLAQITDPLLHATYFSYDGVGNVTQIMNPLNQAIQFGYDLRFNKSSSITNPLGKTTSFAYDAKGNLTAATYPDSTRESYAYDSVGNLTSVQDASGKITQYAYNTQGQMTAQQNALGNTTQFSYDTAGALQNVTDAKGHIVSHTRDSLERLTQRAYPDTSRENYEYDGAGKVTAFTNRRGEKITFSYDVTGRLEWKIYPSGKKTHFLYDAAGYPSSVEQVSGTTTTLDTAYERDALHRITKAKVPGKVYPESYDVSYAYDAAGRKTFMSYLDGYSLNYAYDAANRLTRISDAGNSTIVAYEYDAVGRRTRKTLGNGTYTTYQYDDLDRLALLVNNSPSGTVQSRFAYSYNAAGMRTSMTTVEGVNSYTYDNAYQLTHVTYPGGRSVDYSFDKVGNRTSVTDNSVVTNYTTNQLDQYTQAGAETFGYDTNGNLTTHTLNSATTTYGWDEDDRLVSVDRNGVHIDYRYDYQGRLVSKTIGGQETRYIWDSLELIAEVDSSGTVIKRYVFGASIDEAILVVANGANYWTEQDGLGSVVGVTNNGGAVAMAASYDVYGNIRAGAFSLVPQRFAGMRWDEDVGLYYAMARWYEPLTGRFVSYDPMFLKDGQNRYTYVANNPINFVDTLGYERIWWNTFWNEFMKSTSAAAIGELEGIVEGVTSGVTFGLWKYNADLGSLYSYGDCVKCSQSYWEGLAGGNFAGGLFATIPGSAIIEGLQKWAGLNKLARLPNSFGDMIQFGNNRLQETKSIKELESFLHFADIYQLVQEVLRGIGGGNCPTFIQAINSSNKKPHNITEARSAQISVPWTGSLLRSDIPIYGIASGKDFSRYRVEYGEGSNPSAWHLIEESDEPQNKAPDFKDISWMQGDLDLKGNLATWNTGLKNWSHLPWHPPEDPTDLNGVYTLRLTVFGKDGEKAEDKITVEVGRAIAQCLPGIAVSPDKRVTMRFPEQALTHPFRVYTILPLRDVREETPVLAKGFELIGQAYRVREPGDKFIKDVSLEFNAGAEDVGNRKPEDIGIGHYDTAKNEWILLNTTYDRNSSLFSTVLTELPSPKAIYALVYNAENKLSSPAQPPSGTPASLKPARPGVLVDNTFESDRGTVKQRDRIVGATLSRDNTATPDGSYCLKLSNENHGGNFSSTLIDQPFDTAEYGTMTFDYRVGMGVKVDFFLKVDGRWYNLRFTGDAVDYRNKDVNIANLGAVEGVLADDKWHTANVDLRYLLHQHTQHTRVDEVIMANWSVGGYMKLEFGNNPRGATYYIDNFKLIGPGIVDNRKPVLMVDDFNGAGLSNTLGGAFGAYCNPGTQYVDASLVPAAKNPSKDNRALALTFDTTQPDAYGGYWTSIAGAELKDYAALAFRVRTDGKLSKVVVGVRNKQGVEGRTDLRPYLLAPGQDGWRDVSIPLTALRGLADLSLPDVLFFSVSHKDGSGKGRITIDDLRFEKQPFQKVTDFESPDAWTLLGGDYATFQNGAAAISISRMKDSDRQNNSILRISYGGTIGHDYGPDGGFSYAAWRAGLNGVDARKFAHLVMAVRGERGGETPNIYLSDPVKRVPMRAKEFPAITKEWQTVRLPLTHYAKEGVDLSHLDALEILFEWTEQSGTIYVDDIRFE